MPFAAGLLCAKCIILALSNFSEPALLYIIEGARQVWRLGGFAFSPSVTQLLSNLNLSGPPCLPCDSLLLPMSQEPSVGFCAFCTNCGAKPVLNWLQASRV